MAAGGLVATCRIGLPVNDRPKRLTRIDGPYFLSIGHHLAERMSAESGAQCLELCDVLLCQSVQTGDDDFRPAVRGRQARRHQDQAQVRTQDVTGVLGRLPQHQLDLYLVEHAFDPPGETKHADEVSHRHSTVATQRDGSKRGLLPILGHLDLNERALFADGKTIVSADSWILLSHGSGFAPSQVFQLFLALDGVARLIEDAVDLIFPLVEVR